MRFEIWAPRAGRVELWLDGATIPMSRVDGDRCSIEVEAGPGSIYGFLLDGRGPLPDPRSRLRPEGIDGLSQVPEPLEPSRRFDAPPLSDWIIYELHVGTFSPEGTFAGAERRLDHLMELGVTAVELMPVNTFSGTRGWGYDGAYLYAPHPAYGAPQDLRRLIDACHSRGLAVVLDVVYNHFGPAGNHLAEFGPYFTDTYSTLWGDAVNFDERGSDEVRAFFIDNALMWLEEYGFDGLRLDAIHAIFDRSAVHLLEELSERVDRRARELNENWYLIAESDLNDPRVVTPRHSGGLGMDAQWSDDLHHALHAVLTGESSGIYRDFGTLAHLEKALRSAFVYDGIYSRYRGKRHGRAPKGASGRRFLAYMQDHDQVGNRARGDRITETCGPELQMIGAALVMTSPFVPMLFMGEEWAATSPFPYFTSHSDPELGRAVAEGRKREFAGYGWDTDTIPDPQAEHTFNSAKLDWVEVAEPAHSEMLRWYKDLIALRSEHRELRSGNLDEVAVTSDEEARTFTVERPGFTVACNLSDVEVEIELAGEREILLASKKQRAPNVLEPRSVSILREAGRV